MVAPNAAQIAHQREHIGVAHDEAVAVDHRQREAGALQQAAERARVGERDDARARAAADSLSAASRHCAQLRQRVAAGQGGEQQAVGLQRAADLDQRARQVVDLMQGEQRDGEIEGAFGERRPLGVADEAGEAAFAEARRGRRDAA